MMRGSWFNKKALFYFGGAFVLLLGGAIVLLAPYHYTSYISNQGDTSAFDIWEESGYYPQLEITTTVRPETNGSVIVDISIKNNDTQLIQFVNITMTLSDKMPGVDPLTYEYREIVDLQTGAYTIRVERIEGASNVELSLKQISDSRLYIVIGGVLNIVGLLMGATGYCIGGSLIPSSDDVIVDWGYETEDESESQ
ncbi:hypothetical protein EU537_02935 [Candidatus Thorarchaeota archaeon]|nr:MAG: hypothetical protein EU537_02935 [Candidatus Thorarchaeota archaeon]